MPISRVPLILLTACLTLLTSGPACAQAPPNSLDLGIVRASELTSEQRARIDAYVSYYASQIAAAAGEPLDFTIEESGNFDLGAFLFHVGNARRTTTAVDIMDWSVVDESRIRTAKKREEHRLSVADGIAHAFFRALTPEGPFDQPEHSHQRNYGSKKSYFGEFKVADDSFRSHGIAVQKR